MTCLLYGLSHRVTAHQPQPPQNRQDGSNGAQHKILLSLGHGFTAGWRLRHQPAARAEPPGSGPRPWSCALSHASRVLVSIGAFVAFLDSFVRSQYWVLRGARPPKNPPLNNQQLVFSCQYASSAEEHEMDMGSLPAGASVTSRQRSASVPALATSMVICFVTFMTLSSLPAFFALSFHRSYGRSQSLIYGV
jgi:hypothetical protein